MRYGILANSIVIQDENPKLVNKRFGLWEFNGKHRIQERYIYDNKVDALEKLIDELDDCLDIAKRELKIAVTRSSDND